MNTSMKSCPGVHWRARSVLLAFVLASCGGLEPNEDSVVLTNRGDRPLIARVVELETSHRYDPDLRFEVEEEAGQILAPGASRTISGEEILGGYDRGQDIRVFVYEVREGEAVLGDIRTFSHAELAERDFEVELP